MNAAVITADRGQSHRGAIHTGIEIASVDRAIVEHDTVRDRVDVLPNDCPAVRNAGGVWRKRLRAILSDDVDDDGI